MPSVRITAYPAHWLTEDHSFADRARITWSTGEKTKPGDIQVFAVSATLGDEWDLADDPRRDAVHSIWQAITPPLEELGETEWPIQCKFKLLVKLDNPVPKAELIQAGLLKRAWPQSSRGKLLRTEDQINTLSSILSNKNPNQRPAIFVALGLRPATASDGVRGNSATKKPEDKRNDTEAAVEEAFVEGEIRAARAKARSSALRAAAKSHWGLKCYCCGFDFERFYGDIAKGVAIVHHLQPFANGKRRKGTVKQVRVVCANCHYVIHVEDPPYDVDDLKKRIGQSWTEWSEESIEPRR